MLPVMVATVGEVLSPLFNNPPFKINPGLPPTPAKLRVVGGVPFVLSSVFVFRVSELPAKVSVPDTAGDRMRVLFKPFPMLVPLDFVAYALPTTGATAVPVPLVCQMAAVQSVPAASTEAVVRLAMADGVALTWLELAVAPPGFGTKLGNVTV